ncbi:hypothetical protein [Kitasatospora sp. NPDC001175]|uniref:hypothetical protein n=1 Tax=Kitasatospora sp. NPDC001175 TaxID=3157103 RepID=UPI003D042CA5
MNMNLRAFPATAAIVTVASIGLLAAGPASAAEILAAPQAPASVEGTIIRDTGIYFSPSLDSQKMGMAYKDQKISFACWTNPTHQYPFFKMSSSGGYYIPRDFVNLSSNSLPQC